MKFLKIRKVLGAGAMVAIATLSVPMAATAAATIANNIPGFVKSATVLGKTATSKTIAVTVWLKPRNKSQLDALVASQYDPKSASYRHWLTPEAFEASYAPTAADATTVSQFLTKSGLTVLSVGPKNMYVRAQGTVGAVNSAFQVVLHDFNFQGATHYANTTAPVVSDAAASLIGAVYGLHDLTYTHPYVTQTLGGSAGKSSSRIIASSAPSISDKCISGSENETVSGSTPYPEVKLSGNGYSTASGSLGGCGYTPPEIQKAYGLTALYKKGLNGAGQTIVIIDWCGSPTILADANTFSASYGLPALTSSNFQIISSSTPATCGAPDPEINIDVEWAHAIAPGANIDLVVPPSANFSDVDAGVFYAVINGLGSVISGSYGSEELYDSPAEVQTESLINEIAAANGISTNFSSGDSGDFTFDLGLPPSVSVPADSPYATSVGGVSLTLNKTTGAIAWQSGWGTNIALIEDEGIIIDPPTLAAGFDFGSGGGPSGVFAKPSYQAALAGSARQVPDISWLADPYTGAVIVISASFQSPEQVYEVYGGTSLACPMFSALWAIANQAAGAPLGQAAPYLYTLPASAIFDITPVSSPTNVTAKYKESATVTDDYTAAELAGPLENTTEFVSAIWNYPLLQDTIELVTFGTDSGLVTGRGWDNVTGVGVPSPAAFVGYFTP
jgi:subtilase family serine protease